MVRPPCGRRVPRWSSEVPHSQLPGWSLCLNNGGDGGSGGDKGQGWVSPFVNETHPRRGMGAVVELGSPWASWASSFCWSMCVITVPNAPSNVLIRPSQSVYLPLFSHFQASLSPLDPSSCFPLTRHHGLVLAARDRMQDINPSS